MQFSRSQATLEPRRKKSKTKWWNATEQFCWHLLVSFHSQSVNPWSSTTILKFKGKCWGHIIMRIGNNKKVCQNFFGSETTDVSQCKWKADTFLHKGRNQRKEVRSSEFLSLQLPYNFNMEVYKKYYFSLTCVLWHYFLYHERFVLSYFPYNLNMHFGSLLLILNFKRDNKHDSYTMTHS